MWWKIALAGIIMTTTLLLVASGFALIHIRHQQIASPSSDKETVIFKESSFEQLPPQSRQAISQDVQAQNRLLRGKLLTYNPEIGLLTLAYEVKNDRGDFQVVDTMTVNISSLETFLCWPEFLKTSDGTAVPLKEAFFPVDNHSVLTITGEYGVSISSLPDEVDRHPGSFVLLEEPLSNQPRIISQDTTLEAPPVKQLVVLGCHP